MKSSFKIWHTIKTVFCPKGLSRLDYYFFIPAGILLALLMVFCENFWPEKSTLTFNALLQDHMPVMTIEILFVTIFAVTLVHLALKKSHNLVVTFLNTFIERLHQLTAPIMLILSGMALGLLICALPSLPFKNRYFHYALDYFLLAFYPYSYIFCTNLLALANVSTFSSDTRTLIEDRLYARAILILFGIVILVGGIFYIFSKEPAVTLNFTDEQYLAIKAEAAKHQQTPEDYLKTRLFTKVEQN